MSGIEIISKVEIMDPPDWAAPVVLISFFAMLITYALAKIFEGLNKTAESISILSCFICFLLLIGGFCGMGQKTEPTGLYQYEAYIEEEVHMAEFFDKYEEKRYTVKSEGRINNKQLRKENKQ